MKLICSICGFESEAQDPHGPCPQCGSLARSVSAVGDAPTPTGALSSDVHLLNQIRSMAESENPPQPSPHALFRDPILSQLRFLPAQILPAPLTDSDPVNSVTLIGSRATRSLQISYPMLLSVSPDLTLSTEAEDALLLAAREFGSIINLGYHAAKRSSRREGARTVLSTSLYSREVPEPLLEEASVIEISIGDAALRRSGQRQRAAEKSPAAFTSSTTAATTLRVFHPEDLWRFVDQLRRASRGAPVGFRLAPGHVERDVRNLLLAEPDFFVLDVACSVSALHGSWLRREIGMPLAFFLSRTVSFLEEIGRRSDAALIVHGGLCSGADVAKALALGADAAYISTPLLLALGCQQCGSCLTGPCPAGIAIGDLSPSHRLDVRLAADRLNNFLRALVTDLTAIARIVGKSDVHSLDREDLVSLDPSIAGALGVQFAGSSKEE